MAFNPAVYAPKPYRAPVLLSQTQTAQAPQLTSRFNQATQGFESVAGPQLVLQRQDEDNQQSQGEPGITLPPADPDPFVGCSLVPGLTMDNFWPYVKSLDATFVMFYDPIKPMSALAKLQVRGAARRTKRPNHKYAAVDCSMEEELCSLQCICQTPAYKLFSRGSLVGTYEDVETLRANQIQKYVETSPVIDNRAPMSGNR